MKKRFLALFLALLLAPMWALGEDLLYEVDPETGEVLFWPIQRKKSNWKASRRTRWTW